ncbi:MAG: hypothetical protein OXL37_06360 [Chloroflexota bacterium]|nr:hypothetical protein [Chloroflexota bacterium]MDE2959898.1 hypothetical protein [Chloroflexota bacterium]
MATTGRDNRNLETGRLAADGIAADVGAGEVTVATAKRSRVLDSGGLFYTYASATAVTFLGTLSLIWGNHQDSVGIQSVGMCLLLVGCLIWTAAFAVMTWWMARDTGPLLWHWIKRARQDSPKKAADGIEN